MELLASAIRTLFYDFNVSSLYTDIKNHTNSFIKGDFVEQASWQARAFTKSELRCLQEYVKQKCHCGKAPKWHQMLNVLPEFTVKCLINNNGTPTVTFGKLQEWRELSLLLGEDLLTTVFLAFHQHKPVSFDWPNIIHHDNEGINNVLKNGLCDTHAHLKASADVFELTWLDFMNRLINRDDDYQKVLYMADSQIQYRRDQQNFEFRKMVQMAAILRLHIFEILNGKKTAVPNTGLLKMLDDDVCRTKHLVEFESRIRSYQTADNKIFNITHEYAIQKKPSSEIYAIHSGERELLYQFFSRYFKRNPDTQIINLADLFFLYISLKIRVRKEFVQTNPLFGFDNFKMYEHRKTKFCSDDFKKIFPLYAIQSSIRPNTTDKMEARVTPIEIPKQEIRICIDGNNNNIRGDITDENLTYIIYFIKQSEYAVHKKHYGIRYDYGEKYRKEIDGILSDTIKRYAAKQHYDDRPYPPPIYKIVGIDAAGAEIDCSPAVFGQTYRYARLRGLTNLTYHVGEDFYDLCDGLKAIDDAIRFLNLDTGSRLGHVIALGISTKQYYERREYQTIMSRQRLLDTLVWIHQTISLNRLLMSVKFSTELEDKAKDLYYEVGYRILPFDIETYYMSMMLRSDSLDKTDKISCWGRASVCQDSLCTKARDNKNALALCHEFLTSKDVWKEGNAMTTYTYLPEIVEIASALQACIQREILKKNIIIETNPSSNVVIGPIDRYEEHTLHQFVKNGIVASINTDDKGIFSTSLYNEYSLYASSASLIGVSDADIINNIKRIHINAENSRFRAPKLTL